jgi:hypothetical protein
MFRTGKQQRSEPSDICSRRRVLGALGLVSMAAAAGTAALPRAARAYEPGPNETQRRYRVTEHVQAFYRTNGYEGVRK